MDQSPLSRIAREVRNRIYELVLTQPESVRIDESSFPIVFTRYQPHRRKLLALTETCRAIRDECTQLFYATNEFSLVLRTSSRGLKKLPLALQNFYTTIGESNSRALRRIVVDLTPYWKDDWECQDEVLDSLCAFFDSVQQNLPKSDIPCKSKVKCHFMYTLGSSAKIPQYIGITLDLQALYSSWHNAMKRVEEEKKNPHWDRFSDKWDGNSYEVCQLQDISEVLNDCRENIVG